MWGNVYSRAFVVLVTAAAGAGLAGCASVTPTADAGTAQSAGAASSTPSVTQLVVPVPSASATTGSAGGTTTGATAASSLAPATPRPTGSICPDAPGTEIVAADGTTTVGGSFALTGYRQVTICGPGVPDDVQYSDAGSHTTFVIPASAQVTLLGASASQTYSATVADLRSLLATAPFVGFKALASASPEASPSRYVLWSPLFQLRVSSDGTVLGVTSLYHP